MSDPPEDPSPVPLQYAPRPQRRGLRYWLSRFITRLSQPMPLGMLYLIGFILAVIGTVIAVLIVAIVRAFH